MKPTNLHTQIFLDSGDPQETKAMLETLGFLDGQTTNPSLIAKSPVAQERLASGNPFTQQEVFEYYKTTVEEIRNVMPEGSISVEVYADAETTADTMVAQGKQMATWIPGAHIKLPTNTEGLKVARELVDAGYNVNMTLVFSQVQAAAVYAATAGATKGQVFLSPFIGRLDDIGQSGMDLIVNVLNMYKEKGDGHVEVLTASVRSMEHFLAAISLGSDIITAPAKILSAWAEDGMSVPSDYTYMREDLAPIAYEELSLGDDVSSYNIQHDLTDKGLEKFVADWKALFEK
ncbi:MAG: transaldolase [Candidatus Magasanikbacteria bacterium CG_4_9_14_0_2_um_filter_41_10]|uniref:Transaldolase n=1 Tax=Candidatus Magasanikbacteria bacterium CG_4_10_14_0_2_um_filter_41_31 TaxID=1974639 RepID=A0A2M7V344_9BACT|nr:MAG: transaldolase [Candidatus Magasanikbacteria bacterium CG1_02_41_34]PIZ92884.1 MAG: transaldolase [Candidatus Magasanikbacteria bacterium CG_4_10_14_0_2_um_filter_41_31]PJC53425.1 MAG: transaldolase [Candidatus Magasanikbacteria bacterium CG_4_9_14_0_2_um_filter_41_10]